MGRLVVICVLTEINHSEWAAPSFIVPNKDGRVRFISDFRRLNKQNKFMLYPLPYIKNMLNKLYNFTYATTLDLMMGYYNILFTYASKRIFSITTPFGRVKYNRLPMEVYIAPDIFQEKLVL